MFDAVHDRVARAVAVNPAASGYPGFLRQPEAVTKWCRLVAIAGSVTVVVLAIIFGEGFWQEFDHVVAGLAVVGLLLALPALSYAATTERRLEDTQKDVGAALSKLSDLPAIIGGPSSATTTVDSTQPAPSIALTPSPPGASPLAIAAARLGVPADSRDAEQALRLFALESAIDAGADESAVHKLASETDLFVLGQPAGDTSMPGRGTESDILHFTADVDEEERSFMPVFTRNDVLRNALIRNPDWQSLSVLEVAGGDLLATRDDDVTIVIDPWDPHLEFQLPPAAE